MASPATMNAWLEELAHSISPKSKTQRLKRRQIDTFCRRVKTHTFLRTNQFEVNDRLDGLKEKFQIFDRDDLSDALHERLLELRGHEQQWIPDTLDLLLRLSYDPVNKARLTDLDGANREALTALPLKWADLAAEDDSGSDDQIWAVPVFDDQTSDEEVTELSEAAPTPPDNADADVADKGRDQYNSARVWDGTPGTIELPPFLKSTARDNISELQIAREVLLMVQGLPTTIFLTDKRRNPSIKYGINLRGVAPAVFQPLLDRAIAVRKVVETVQAWVNRDVDVPYIQVVQHGTGRFLNSYANLLSEMTDGILRPTLSATVSLLSIITRIEEEAKNLKVLDLFVRQVREVDAVGCLSCLHDLVAQFDLCGNHVGTKALLPLFVDAFEAYLKSIKPWLVHGKLEHKLEPFFIRAKMERSTMSNLWHDWYRIELDGQQRPASFMLPFTEDIFACGKTSLFLKHISEEHANDLVKLDGLLPAVRSAASNPALPFTAAFSALLGNCFTSLLEKRTAALKYVLNNECGLSRALDAFEFIYLRKDGMIADNLESIIYGRMDRCLDNWNDRFIVADLLEDVYANTEAIDMDSLLVHSVHTSSRNMESQRRSVKILASLAIEYVLPWPLANIIPTESLASYWRVALHLTQIRRAKYALERIAYASVNANPISDNTADQKRAQVLTFMFLNFTNTLYDHFTFAVIAPLTAQMRKTLHSAKSVDDMISVHQKYIDRLETACLTDKSLKLLRETLIGLLDMCIRFADLVSSPSPSTARASDDFEASSFKSAQSLHRRRRRRRRRQHRQRRPADKSPPPTDATLSSSDADDQFEDDDEDDDDDEAENEGYSSFIVLDDDTTIVKEISKLQVQFQRQLEFFIAGIKGVGRGGKGEMVAEMEMLAERLAWRKQGRAPVD